MHIIYLDEAGTGSDASHFVVAGLSFFERQIYYVTEEMDRLQARYFPAASEPIEFHASALRAPDSTSNLRSTPYRGRSVWRSSTKFTRR